MMAKRMLVLGIALVAIGMALPAAAGLRFGEGHWRLELSGTAGINLGGESRPGDKKLHLTVEYEFPAAQRLTLGLRLTPLFYYGGADEDVFGVGVGLSMRLYQKKESYSGLYGELHIDALGHANHFEANDSNLNFQSGVGVGYQFDSGWHLMLQYEHISNASLYDRNSGTNTIGLALGFRF